MLSLNLPDGGALSELLYVDGLVLMSDDEFVLRKEGGFYEQGLES